MNSSLSGTIYTRHNVLFNTLIASGAFLFIYFYFIFRDGLFIDELIDITNHDPFFYAATDRWGITILRLLTSDIMVPVTYGLFSACCIGFAIALQIQHFIVKGTKYLSAGTIGCISLFYIAIHLGIYQLIHILLFSYHADAVCFAYLLMTAGYMAYSKGINEGRKHWFCISVVCFILGTSTYQTLLLLPVIFFCAETLCVSITDEQAYVSSSLSKMAKWLCSLLALSLTTYATITLFIKPFLNPEYIADVEAYRQGSIVWRNTDGYNTFDYIWLVLHVVKRVCQSLMGMEYQGNWFYMTAIIPVITILAIFKKKKGSSQKKWLGIASVLGLWLLPFLPILVFGSSIGGRALYAPPCACALLWCICLKSNINMLQHFPRWVLYLVSAILLINASYAVSSRAFRYKLAHEASISLIEEVKLRAWLTEVPEGVDVYSCPITIIGAYEVPPMTVKFPKFERNPEQTCFPDEIKLHAFHASYTLNKRINFTSQLPKERLEEELSTMSIYPAKGSCRYVEGEILVRME